MKKVLYWFRQDLRLQDNPALTAAACEGKVLPIYILDDIHPGQHGMGGASRWWLHQSLNALNQSLENKLQVFAGDPLELVPALMKKHKINTVFWNRCYEPWRIKRDKKLSNALQKSGAKVESFNGSLLWEPWNVLKKDETPYRVFTPFYRKGCLAQQPPRQPLPAPKLDLVDNNLKRNTVDSLELIPPIRWDKKLVPHWRPGEEGAHERLWEFLDSGISIYRQGRNYPAKCGVSRLSPHIHFGEISPNQAWYAARGCGDDQNIDTFCSELGWREFSYNLLYFNPDLPKKNLQKKFDGFPWRTKKTYLERWQRGQTGYPIVDAGMRELWQTGYMHNRVRMIVGSFLVKNLLLHWHHGERWFWDCLVDADLANNSASWQWISGCGADAAPYFRIFNPVTQGEKFDPTGEYTRRYVPELMKLPDKYLYCPWQAPAEILAEAGVELDHDYPSPIVDLKQSRERALDAFKLIKTTDS